MRYFWIFFWPKSNPYMPLVNFRKKFRFVSFNFRQNFEVRTFMRWLSIRGSKFFLRDIQKNFGKNLHYGPITWVPRRFFQILIFYSQNLHLIRDFWVIFENYCMRMLSIRGTDFIACWAYAEMFKSRISRPNRILFSKNSCYRPLGP